MGKLNLDYWEDMQKEPSELEMSFTEASVKYYGEVYRDGTWIRITGLYQNEQDAKKSAKKWLLQNPKAV